MIFRDLDPRRTPRWRPCHQRLLKAHRGDVGYDRFWVYRLRCASGCPEARPIPLCRLTLGSFFRPIGRPRKRNIKKFGCQALREGNG